MRILLIALLALAGAALSQPLDRSDPEAVARTFLEAFQARDLKRMATTSNETNVEFFAELARAEPGSAIYDEVFSGWRAEAVDGWTGSLGAPRLGRGDSLLFEIGRDSAEVYVLVLTNDGGAWGIEDVNSPSLERWQEFEQVGGADSAPTPVPDDAAEMATAFMTALNAHDYAALPPLVSRDIRAFFEDIADQGELSDAYREVYEGPSGDLLLDWDGTIATVRYPEAGYALAAVSETEDGQFAALVLALEDGAWRVSDFEQLDAVELLQMPISP